MLPAFLPAQSERDIRATIPGRITRIALFRHGLVPANLLYGVVEVDGVPQIIPDALWAKLQHNHRSHLAHRDILSPLKRLAR